MKFLKSSLAMLAVCFLVAGGAAAALATSVASAAGDPGSPHITGGLRGNPGPPPARGTAGRLASGPAVPIKLLNGYSARCLDAATQNIGQNGTTMQLWDCLPGTNQNWWYYTDGTIRNAESGRCLDAALQNIASNGTTVQLWQCNGGLNQKWTFTSSGQIRNQDSGRCLDGDLGGIATNGTRVQLWDCNGSRNQSWIWFYANTGVPNVCNTWTYAPSWQYLFPWSTLFVTFGLSAELCYNGTSASAVPASIHTTCNNPVQLDPACTLTDLYDPPGGTAEAYFDIHSSAADIPWPTGMIEYYPNAYTYLSTNKNGQLGWGTEVGNPIIAP